MSKRIERRILDLEALLPREIALIFADGSEYTHPGPAAKFYNDAVAEIDAGKGPLRAAIRNSVKSRGCGLLAQMLRAMATSIDNLNKTKEQENV